MDRFETGIVAAVVLGTAIAVSAAVAEHRQWTKFAAEHDCRVVSQTSGFTSTGWMVDGNGQLLPLTTHTPGKTGYACDDGVTYWR